MHLLGRDAEAPLQTRNGVSRLESSTRSNQVESTFGRIQIALAGPPPVTCQSPLAEAGHCLFPPWWQWVPNRCHHTEETDRLGQSTLLVSATQADVVPVAVSVSCPAKQLLSQQRQELAVQVLAGSQPIAQLARQHQVSRKFLYQQADRALASVGPRRKMIRAR
jgi:hypothetical protein